MAHRPSTAPSPATAASDARVGNRGRATTKRCHGRAATIEQIYFKLRPVEMTLHFPVTLTSTFLITLVRGISPHQLRFGLDPAHSADSADSACSAYSAYSVPQVMRAHKNLHEHKRQNRQNRRNRRNRQNRRTHVAARGLRRQVGVQHCFIEVKKAGPNSASPGDTKREGNRNGGGTRQDEARFRLRKWRPNRDPRTSIPSDSATIPP